MGKQSFKIDSQIIEEKYILQAIMDFQEVASMQYNAPYLTIDTPDDEEEIFHECMNYIIGLINE